MSRCCFTRFPFFAILLFGVFAGIIVLSQSELALKASEYFPNLCNALRCLKLSVLETKALVSIGFMGNVREWTQDHFNPLDGFKVHYTYDDVHTVL